MIGMVISGSFQFLSTRVALNNQGDTREYESVTLSHRLRKFPDLLFNLAGVFHEPEI